jgi:hypothetical protein
VVAQEPLSGGSSLEELEHPLLGQPHLVVEVVMESSPKVF